MSAMASHVPDRSLQQRLAALDRANAIRSKRAELKADLKHRRRSMVDVLVTPPEYAYTMKVIDVLLASPNIGRVRADLMLKRAQVSPSKTLAGLTQDQLRRLLTVPRPGGVR